MFVTCCFDLCLVGCLFIAWLFMFGFRVYCIMYLIVLFYLNYFKINKLVVCWFSVSLWFCGGWFGLVGFCYLAPGVSGCYGVVCVAMFWWFGCSFGCC